MSPEEWRPVVGYEGTYEVSSLGRVKSLVRPGRRQEMVLKPGVDGGGYLNVGPCRDGISRTTEVHQIVAAAFLGPRPDGLETRHLDGDQTNNAIGNLAYSTHAENEFDQVRHGTHPQASKTQCPVHAVVLADST